MKKLLAVWMLLIATNGFSYTIVGNADDGKDLENLIPLEGGPIIEAREKAAVHLEKLNVSGVRGLGILIAEVRGSKAYMAKEDERSEDSDDKTHFHSDDRQKIFARTLAQPHSVTRFFPIAKGLTQDQLIALHIHEALHRALPPTIREDESAVSQITLALTSPGANRDRVEETVTRYLSPNDLRLAPPLDVASSASDRRVPDGFDKPSNITYGFKQFLPSKGPSTFAVSQMHTLRSDLYAFGSSQFPLGVGLEASMVNGKGGTYMGPLGVSVRANVITERSFALGVFGIGQFNLLSSDELKNSPHGRDLVTLGASLRKNFGIGYVENFLSVTPDGKTKQKIGLVDYEHEYGTAVTAKFRGGVRLWKIDAGAFLQIDMSDYYRVKGGSFSFDSGRYRLVSMGPELSFTAEDFAVSVHGRFLVNSTKDANFDYLGNLMGTGSAQGSVGANVSVFF